MTIIFGLILLFILAYLLNNIFLFNRTIYTLLCAVIVFIFVSCYLIYLGFEFLGLSFFITYVGGIAVMFLFLIVVSDVKNENSKELKRYLPKKNLYLVFLIFFCVVFFSLSFLLSYDFTLFNNYQFKIFVLNDFFGEHIKKVLKYSIASSSDYYFRIFYIKEITNLFKGFDNIIFYNWYNSHVFYSDIFILGSFIYKELPLFIIVISFFLLIAIILACSISSIKVQQQDISKGIGHIPKVTNIIPIFVFGNNLFEIYDLLLILLFIVLFFIVIIIVLVTITKISHIRNLVIFFLGFFSLLLIANFAICLGKNYFFVVHYNILGVSITFKYCISTKLCYIFMFTSSLAVLYLVGEWPDWYIKYIKVFSFILIIFIFVMLLTLLKFSLVLDFNILYSDFIIAVITK